MVSLIFFLYDKQTNKENHQPKNPCTTLWPGGPKTYWKCSVKTIALISLTFEC